jgi:hypothetical protein
MGERLEQAVRENVAKLGYGIAGDTVFDRATGLVLHEADPYGFLTAEDWAIDQAMAGEQAAAHALRVRRIGARATVEMLETQLDACETEVEYSAVYVELDAAWRRWETLS